MKNILYIILLLNICIHGYASNNYIIEKLDDIRYKTIDISVYALDTLTDLGMNRYSVKNLFDNNPNTCWATKYSDEEKYFYDKSGNIKIPLKITFSKPVYLKQIIFNNGLQKSKNLFYANQRAKEIIMEIIFVGGPGYEDTKTFQLKDSLKEQPVDISKLKPWATLFPVEEIWLKINEIYPSNKYNDLCLSDINFEFSSQILYKSINSWESIKNHINKNRIINKQTKTWDWSGLYEHDSLYLRELIYNVIIGNSEALALMNSLAPFGTSHSEMLSVEIKPRLKKFLETKFK